MMRAIALSSAVAVTAGASAAVLQFESTLSGANEVPAAATPGSGTVSMTFDDVTNTILTIDVFVRDLLATVSASHIHLAPAGSNGGVIVNLGSAYLPDGGGFRLVVNNLAFPAANVGALMSGGTYVNVHTSTFPGGEVRGQLTLVPTPGGAALGLCALAGVARRRRR